MIAEQDLISFTVFLDQLESTTPPKRAQIQAAASQRRVDFLNMDKRQICLIINGPKPMALSFLNRPDAHEFLKSIKDDLAEQVRIVAHQVSDLREFGEFMAPGYSRRIGVILRKAKRRDLSDRFDEAIHPFLTID